MIRYTVRCLLVLSLSAMPPAFGQSSGGTFNPEMNGNVNAVAVQPDGKIIAGGQITGLSGQPCNRLGRLNPNGTSDTASRSPGNASTP